MALKKKETKKRLRIGYNFLVGDLFHYGHLRSILFTKSLSDMVICGVITDKGIEEYRVKPIANLEERKAVISALKCVDRVMVQRRKDPTENLKKIHKEFPDAEIILTHGHDWSDIPGEDYVRKIGGKIIQHPYYLRLSNLKIINKIIEAKDNIKDIVDFHSLIYRKDIDRMDLKNKVIASSKADTLKSLKNLLKKSNIENLIDFTVADWESNKAGIIQKVKNVFVPNDVVVRSSALHEDTLEKSNAGSFASILNVRSNRGSEIAKAIEKVIASYKAKDVANTSNQIIVQKQAKDIIISGVVLTRTLEENAPYYLINYDNSSGLTDTVTSGVENQKIAILKNNKYNGEINFLNKLIESVKEIENLFPRIGLDIEFGVNKKGEIIIFQARPLVNSLKLEDKDNKIYKKIKLLKTEFKKLSQKRRHLAGNFTIFGDMPDWNPAEIIGSNPNPLDGSLYRYIITDSIWHQARKSQGYVNVNPAKLVCLFGNKPYIDVRSSFNSFIPKNLPKYLKEKLIHFYLDKLKRNPHLQDKIEFQIVFTCYDFCFDDRKKELLNYGFSEKDIKKLRESLIELTNNLILSSKDSIKKDLENIRNLELDRKNLMKEINSQRVKTNRLIESSKLLLDNCKENGTLQFSRLARLAFVGKILLKSLVQKKILDKKFYNDFLNSTRTVATKINEDFDLLSSGNLSERKFINKYYHLRPGTYDITSLRYEDIPDLFKQTGDFSYRKHNYNNDFVINKRIKKNINENLRKAGLKFNADEFFQFTRASLEAREYSKFEFTKNLSDTIELVAKIGGRLGFSREEMAMLNIEDILKTSGYSVKRIKAAWKNKISENSLEKKLNNKLLLPSIIFSEKDFDSVVDYIPSPNYITQKKINGELVILNNNDNMKNLDLNGKIVMIENGDPGYDWIFTRNIGGLVTKYGGVASHMSIRCAELSVPAAIGCGALYDQMKMGNYAVLDCNKKDLTLI